MVTRIKIVLTLAAVLTGVPAARAQFTIPRDAGRQSAIARHADSVRRAEVVHEDVFSPARERERRLARRKERNTTEFNAKVSLTQTQFDNWASGGENTITTLSTLFFRHQYKRTKFGFENRLDAKYGMNYIGRKMFKNQDVFQVNSLVTWGAGKYWSYSADAELRSQFAVGRRSRTDNTMISTFMAPGYFKVAGGFVYKRAPWTVNISPVGGSAVFMLDDELMLRGYNGVPAGERSKWQMGPSLRVIYEKGFWKDAIKVRSEAYSFTNIKTAPTLRWESRVDIQATKYLTTTLYSLVQYDKYAFTPKPDHIQYQYSIAIGLQYTFKNK